MTLAVAPQSRYTIGMKTAISLPDEVFESAEKLAKRLKLSRSELYSRALAEYLARHAPDDVTEAWNSAIQDLGQPADDVQRRAAARVLKRSEW